MQKSYRSPPLNPTLHLHIGRAVRHVEVLSLRMHEPTCGWTDGHVLENMFWSKSVWTLMKFQTEDVYRIIAWAISYRLSASRLTALGFAERNGCLKTQIQFNTYVILVEEVTLSVVFFLFVCCYDDTNRYVWMLQENFKHFS